MVVYGLVNAGAVAAGSWFGPLRWRWWWRAAAA
jgi:hypothetical protein